MGGEHRQQPCCIFPALVGDSSQQISKRRLERVQFNWEPLQSNSNATNLIQLAWGVVLRLYAGSEDIAFLYANGGAQKSRFHLCSFQLQGEESLQILAGDDSHNVSGWQTPPLDVARDVDKFQGNVNTMVVESAAFANDWEQNAPLPEALYSGKLVQMIDLVLEFQRSNYSTHNIIIHYSPSVIDGRLAKSVVETFKETLTRLFQNSKLTVNDINPCSAYDFDQLKLWNPSIPEPEAECIHQTILKQCSQNPGDVAVDSWDGVLTYRELDFLSAELGQRLLKQGFSTGTLAVLCFEKSKWAIVAVLGVLRAGGAFAFVDPSSPLPRMQSICQDLQAKYMVCSTAHSELGQDLNLHTIIASTPASLSPGSYLKDQVINSQISPSSPIYVAFSSGSTGKPKGVVIEHRGFWLRAMANKEILSLGKSSRTLQFANYVFDVSNRDILYTLMFGGCICVPSDYDRYNNLTTYMTQKQINWASLTPSVSNLLDSNNVPHLRQLVLCGEPMTPLHTATWKGKVDLINAYGPSEAVTISAIRTNMSPTNHHMNIGNGSGSNLWIVDANDYEKVLPIGAVGELLIESPSVGRGYINNPELTNSSFLRAPSWLQNLRRSSSLGRVYMTGDLARLESDGSIRFIGRKDSQVKIRGQRVELSEVEHHIQCLIGEDLGIPVLVDIIAPKGINTDILVAFLPIMQSTRRNARSDLQEILRDIIPSLEEKLSQILPSYMIPSRFLIVKKIPMTATGKRNRQQLRREFAAMSLDDLDEVSPVEKKRSVPTSGIEQHLQQMWASVLGIEPSMIGSDHSFFRLGGNSIMAMQVASLARSEGLDVSVADILEHKQLGRLAAILSTRPTVSTTIHAIPFSLLHPGDMDKLPAKLEELRARNMIADIVPVTETQAFFLTQWSLSSYCLPLAGVVDVDRLHAACQTVVSQHSSLRSIYMKVGDTIVQVFLKTIDVPFNHLKVDDSLESACQKITKNDIAESPMSGNLPIKFTIISKSEKEHALMVRVSHAQYDGYSSPILFKGLSTAYNSLSQIPAHSLPTPYSHYVYACHQSKTKQALEFWRRNLQGSSMTILPTHGSYYGDRAPTDIRQTASSKLPTPPEDLTVPNLMNAALAVVLSRRLQVYDVVFGVVMNTRDIALPGVEQILGSCININPLRGVLEPTRTVLGLCNALQDQYVNVARYGYLDLPYIVANCTDWDPQTKPGVMINHLDGAKQPIHLKLDGAVCTSSEWKADIKLIDQILIRSITVGDELRVQILTSDKILSAEAACAMARELADTARLLSKNPNVILSSLYPGQPNIVSSAI